MKEISRKDLTIETLRGIAIVFMVLGHVIGDSTTSGLNVKNDSFWRFFYYLFENIRMPLFTVISGYIYAYKPLSRFASNSRFVAGKFNRLFIPLVVVSTLFFLTQYMVPGTNLKNELGDIWTIYFYSYAHFWFLQGMIVVFLIITFLESVKALNTLKSSLIIFLIVAVIYISDVHLTRFFSLHRVPFLLAFFIFGLCLKRFNALIFKSYIIKTGLVIFILLYVYQIYLFNYRPVNPQLEHILTLFIGTSACMLLINLNLKNKVLIWLGNYSYAIYLFHVFGSAAGRMILNRIGIHNISIHVIFGLIVALSFPLALRLLIPPNNILSTLFFGDKIKVSEKTVLQTGNL